MQAQRQITADPRSKLYGEHIDADPSDIIEPFRLLGLERADKKAAYEFLYDMKKVVHAQQKGIAEQNYPPGKPPSETYLDRIASASQPYVDILKKTSDAHREYLIIEANYIAEDKRIELLRSLESSARSQLNKLSQA